MELSGLKIVMNLIGIGFFFNILLLLLFLNANRRKHDNSCKLKAIQLKFLLKVYYDQG